MSIPAVCIVGWANAGKTTLIEKLLPVFAQKGLKVGVIKHSHHLVEMDKPGADTFRYTSAGAKSVMLSTPVQSMTMEQGELRLTELMSRMHGVDLILVEGFDKEACLPMIEVWRDKSQQMRSPAQWRRAVVTAGECPCGVPVFAPDEAEKVANFVLELIQERAEEAKARVRVLMNGQDVSMVPFIEKMVENICRGTLKALKGYDEGCSIDIHIDRE